MTAPSAQPAHAAMPAEAIAAEAMPSSPLRVGVAVVTYNSEPDVPGFVQSLREAAAHVPLRLVVADNASRDRTVARLREYDDLIAVDVLPSPDNRGYAAGINAAAALLPATAPLLVLNPDTRVEAGCLEALLAAGEDPSVGVVVPRLVDAAGRTQPSLRRDPSVLRAFAEAVLGGRRAGRLGVGEVVGDPARYETAADVDWATGAALLVTPAARAAVGDWDERFFLYSEETDYLQRVRAAGLRVVFEPAAVVSHRGGAAHTDPALWTLLTLNRVRLFGRHHRVARFPFYLAVLVNEVVRIPAGRPHRRAAGALLRRAPEVLR